MEPQQAYQKETIDDLLQFVNPVTELIKRGDYLSALFVTENLPGDYKTDALYAGIAISIAEHMDKADKQDGYQVGLGKAMLDYCQKKSGYFNQK